jgi:hypothetical protein
MDALQMIAGLKAALDPILGKCVFSVSRGQNFANDDSVYLTYANVPKGSDELACMNAKKRFMISITDGRKYGASGWGRDMPALVKAAPELQ